MRDGDIRSAVAARLGRRYDDDPKSLIRHELGLGAGERRVDLAVINGEIAGFEIKSDADTLVRLADQAAVYGRVLDRVTLVTTAKYLDSASTAVPQWWGLWLAWVNRRGAVSLRQRRAAGTNDGQDPFVVAQLLWRQEALEELAVRGLHRGLSNRPRWYAWERLAQNVALPELKAVVRDRLRARPAWPGGQ